MAQNKKDSEEGTSEIRRTQKYLENILVRNERLEVLLNRYHAQMKKVYSLLNIYKERTKAMGRPKFELLEMEDGKALRIKIDGLNAGILERQNCFLNFFNKRESAYQD